MSTIQISWAQREHNVIITFRTSSHSLTSSSQNSDSRGFGFPLGDRSTSPSSSPRNSPISQRSTPQAQPVPYNDAAAEQRSPCQHCAADSWQGIQKSSDGGTTSDLQVDLSPDGRCLRYYPRVQTSSSPSSPHHSTVGSNTSNKTADGNTVLVLGLFAPVMPLAFVPQELSKQAVRVKLTKVVGGEWDRLTEYPTSSLKCLVSYDWDLDEAWEQAGGEEGERGTSSDEDDSDDDSMFASDNEKQKGKDPHDAAVGDERRRSKHELDDEGHDDDEQTQGKKMAQANSEVDTIMSMLGGKMSRLGLFAAAAVLCLAAVAFQYLYFQW